MADRQLVLWLAGTLSLSQSLDLVHWAYRNKPMSVELYDKVKKLVSTMGWEIKASEQAMAGDEGPEEEAAANEEAHM